MTTNKPGVLLTSSAWLGCQVCMHFPEQVRVTVGERSWMAWKGTNRARFEVTVREGYAPVEVCEEHRDDPRVQAVYAVWFPDAR
jgi:hypothetical protein